MIAYDNFNRADENPLTGWTVVTGENNLQIISNVCRGTSTAAAGNAAYKSNVPSGTNQYAQVTIVNKADSTSPLVRVSEAANSFYAIKTNLGTVYQVYKKIAGVDTSLNQWAITPQVGDVLRLTAIGNQITFYLNGVAQTPTITDADLASGRVGGRIGGGGGGVAAFDNWEGGDIITGGTNLRTLTGVGT